MKNIISGFLGAALVGFVLAACGGGSTCAVDADCTGAGETCQVATGQCIIKCTASSTCPMSKNYCDTALGYCTTGPSDGGTKTDGGTDAGTTPADAGVSCNWGTCLGTNEFCSATTLKCEVKTCNSANQPDVCGYANACDGNNTCYNVINVVDQKCPNLTPPGGKAPTFNPSTSTGPVIYYIDDLKSDDSAFCAAGSNAFSYNVYAYRTDADWPTALTAIPSFKYVKTDGTEVSAVPSMRPSGYKPSGKVATFKVTLCPTAVSTNLTAGFYFAGGYEGCGYAATPNQP